MPFVLLNFCPQLTHNYPKIAPIVHLSYNFCRIEEPFSRLSKYTNFP